LPSAGTDLLKPVWQGTRVLEVPSDGLETAKRVLATKPDSEPSVQEKPQSQTS
jgi:hypothetical protein